MKFAKDERGWLHIHAFSFFRPLQKLDYFRGFIDIIIAALFRARTINFHLPYELQFNSYLNLNKGWRYVQFLNWWAGRLKVMLVWENTNILNPQDWSLVENPVYIPKNLALCFDLGHFILGSKSKRAALLEIDRFFHRYGRFIRHLHLHVNNLRSDQHLHSPEQVIRFLGKRRFQILTAKRTFIFEPG